MENETTEDPHKEERARLIADVAKHEILLKTAEVFKESGDMESYERWNTLYGARLKEKLLELEAVPEAPEEIES